MRRTRSSEFSEWFCAIAGVEQNAGAPCGKTVVGGATKQPVLKDPGGFKEAGFKGLANKLSSQKFLSRRKSSRKSYHLFFRTRRRVTSFGSPPYPKLLKLKLSNKSPL